MTITARQVQISNLAKSQGADEMSDEELMAEIRETKAKIVNLT